ncbi:hypothetical protein TWF481_001545 [Arthrobotrys musiformis]|uniref:WSC domain-containing protein n=1 Tax=Arthrobotrys musiformis TaxID=47236 RepID=A0AAV9VUM2_9PEZI
MPRVSIATTTVLSCVLFVALVHPATALAQSTSGTDTTLAVYPGLLGYIYLGCYNETLDITNDRAIYGGNVTKSTDMTVGKCLEICKGGGSYNYAGLEYTSECWCGPYLSDFSQKLEDGQCDLGCAGNNSQACGGALRVSVYKLQSNSAIGVLSGRISTRLVILASAVCAAVLLQ